MAQADRMAEAQAVVEAEREAVRACEAEIAALRQNLLNHNVNWLKKPQA
ncbi:hypothetical protein [Nereida sp. MMG025]|nr:hypothetical protein [Nereida sp. MMG025]MCF6446117.1 hypothetical protein [Nereida sp. MMG025]